MVLSLIRPSVCLNVCLSAVYNFANNIWHVKMYNFYTVGRREGHVSLCVYVRSCACVTGQSVVLEINTVDSMTLT